MIFALCLCFCCCIFQAVLLITYLTIVVYCLATSLHFFTDHTDNECGGERQTDKKRVLDYHILRVSLIPLTHSTHSSLIETWKRHIPFCFFHFSFGNYTKKHYTHISSSFASFASFSPSSLSFSFPFPFLPLSPLVMVWANVKEIFLLRFSGSSFFTLTSMIPWRKVARMVCFCTGTGIFR